VGKTRACPRPDTGPSSRPSSFLEEFEESYIVSSDPDHHAERIREVERLGATIVCLQNGSGADPHGALKVYGEHVLPALRGTRV
jgi:alkanesulfonate monooxygenase SsuD/methylene tetrahydromethanopterin reductase-like flavin-dependent oxidoreductase (luciferase family)